jgi:hypothetical protein
MADQEINFKKLQARAAHVRDHSGEIVAYDEKHLKWAIWIKVGIAAFIALYLGWAYANVRDIDADLVVYSASEQLVDALPRVEAQMTAYAKDMAPEVVDQGAEQVLAHLPVVRENLELGARQALNSLADQAEAELIAAGTQFIVETRISIDQMVPEAETSYEKITMLRDFILEDLDQSLGAMSDEIGASVLEHSLVPELRRLLEGENLTEKEQLQRDVIALAYLLFDMKINQDAGGLGLIE